jgi:hypothetical protein
MDSSIIILFYSKYCQASLQLIQTLQPYIQIKKICVDNKDIRETLLNEVDKFNITEVPCIFIFYMNGVINKYEGNKAIEWSNDIIRTFQKTESSLLPQEIKSSFQPILSVNDIQTTTNVSHTDSVLSSSPNEIPTLLTEKEDLMGMKRKIDTNPLIEPQSNISDTEESMYRMDNNRNEKKMSDKKNDSILNIAQLIQAQREKEDEAIHPTSHSRISNH